MEGDKRREGGFVPVADWASGVGPVRQAERGLLEGLATEAGRMSPEALKAWARIARDRFEYFVPYVMRDEEKGEALIPSRGHLEWMELLERYPRLIVWGHVEFGKTSLLAARILWELGRDPNHKIAVVSSAYGMAEKIVRAVSRYIETSPELRQVFPNLKPSNRPGDPWTQGVLTVERPSISRDPSVAAYGFRGSVLGARLTRLYIDDILDFENTYSHHGRNGVAHWITATLLGRLLADARVLFMGNAWHHDDAMHRLSLLPGWVSAKFPAMRANGSPTWPERWPRKRIEEKRLEWGQAEFDRQLLCVVRGEGSSRFQQDWILQCAKRGQGKRLLSRLETVPEGAKVFTGIDLAVKQKATSDFTSFFTLMVHPNGDREPIHVYTDKLKGPAIVRKIKEISQRFGGIFIVEDAGAQDYIRQFVVEETPIPIVPMTASKRNYHPVFGIESMAVELFNGKWIIPCYYPGSYEPEIHSWISDMSYFDPQGHPGDRLMASYYAKEGAIRFPNAGPRPAGTGAVKCRVLG